jgi:recombinational DNA repair protein (RecF pathway)
MGKCSVCGNKILYNAFKRIKGIIYCLKCVPKETIMIVDTTKLDFAEFRDAMKEVAIITVNEAEIAVNEKLAKELGEPMKMTVKPKKKSRKKSKKVKA